MTPEFNDTDVPCPICSSTAVSMTIKEREGVVWCSRGHVTVVIGPNEFKMVHDFGKYVRQQETQE